MQLASTMDTLLRAAVSEITQIFESSLYEHQTHLAQTVGLSSDLREKLDQAGCRRQKKDRQKSKRGKKRLSQGGNASGQMDCSVLIAPEVKVDVPEDWCAPLGCEDTLLSRTKVKQENACPSVSLRPLTVSLWRMPAIKQEVEDDFEPHLLSSLGTMSPIGSTPKDKLNRSFKHSLKQSSPPVAPRQCRRGRSNRLCTIKKEKLECTNLQETDQIQKVKSKKRNHSTTKAYSAQEKEITASRSGKRFSCKFCRKLFDTEFGRNVHIRSHKKCPACLKIFSFPSMVRVHMQTCRSLKKKENEPHYKESSVTPKVSPSKRKPLSPNRLKLVVSPSLKHNLRPSSTNTEKQDLASLTSVYHDKVTSISPKHRIVTGTKNETCTSYERKKSYSCLKCLKPFAHKVNLQKHLQTHVDSEPFACVECPETFRMKALLKLHQYRVHKTGNTNESSGNLACGRPMESTEDLSASNSSNKDKKCSTKVSHRNSQIDGQTPPANRLDLKGKVCPSGFACSQCGKVLSTKYSLIQHFRIHTGEKPVVCDKCGEGFRCHPLRSMHRKKCNGMLKCDRCQKIFPSLWSRNKHMLDVHT